MPERAERTSHSILRLLGYARPYAWLVATVIVFSLLYGGGLTGRAFIMRGFVDDVALEDARVHSLEDLIERAKPADPDRQKLRAERRELKDRVRKNLKRTVLGGVLLILLMPLVRLVRVVACALSRPPRIVQVVCGHDVND